MTTSIRIGTRPRRRTESARWVDRTTRCRRSVGTIARTNGTRATYPARRPHDQQVVGGRMLHADDLHRVWPSTPSDTAGRSVAGRTTSSSAAWALRGGTATNSSVPRSASARVSVRRHPRTATSNGHRACAQSARVSDRPSGTARSRRRSEESGPAANRCSRLVGEHLDGHGPRTPNGLPIRATRTLIASPSDRAVHEVDAHAVAAGQGLDHGAQRRGRATGLADHPAHVAGVHPHPQGQCRDGGHAP